MSSTGKVGSTHREDPLQGKRYSPRPLVVSFVVAICGSSNNNATNRPGHLQASCAGTSEGDRDDLTSIGRCVRNEESPGDAFERLSNGKNLKRVCL
jgi:hypothetical protein